MARSKLLANQKAECGKHLDRDKENTTCAKAPGAILQGITSSVDTLDTFLLL